MAYATVSGKLIDSDGIAWRQATWTAVPVSPSSKPVFPDGTPVPAMSGTLDDAGTFSGQVPITINIRPPGTTLTFTIATLTSAPPVTITKVQVLADPVDLGALLSPRISAPRIPAASIVYAYDAKEITNPKHGNGYVNTLNNRSFIYMQNSWQPIGTSIDPARVAYVDQANTFTQNQTIAGAPPYLELDNTAAAADAKRWRLDAEPTYFSLSTIDDAGGLGQNALYVPRTGNMPTSFHITIPASLDNTANVSGGVYIEGYNNPPPNTACLALINSGDICFVQAVGAAGPRAQLVLRVSAGNGTANIDALTIDGAGVGTFSGGFRGGQINLLPDNSDLNNQTWFTGYFQIDNGVINGPAGIGNMGICILENIHVGGPVFIQKVWFPLDAPTWGSFFQRVYNGGWTGWFRFTGT